MATGHPDTLLLYAAGFGTRMGDLTTDRPKPLIQVAGRALIDHALQLVSDAGISRTVINLHYRGDMIRQHLSGRDVLFSEEQPDILETGGGLKQALPLLGTGPAFTLNSDAVWTGPNPLETLRAAWDPSRMDALLLLVPRETALGHTGGGDFVLDTYGRIGWGPGAIYSGAQIIKTAAVAARPETAFPVHPVWTGMIDGGRAYGVLHTGAWCDVGRPEGIAIAEAMLRGQHG
ncbi:MAG: nucleotidyltransferase family protein [Paracoccaceae bacterium]